MDFVLLLEVYSLEEKARQMDRKQRRQLALELGEKILDRCVGPVDPMAEDTVSLMNFDDVGDAVRLMPGDWFSDEPKVYLWHDNPQTARGVLAPLQKLADHDFTVVQRMVLTEVKRRREASEDEDDDDDDDLM